MSIHFDSNTSEKHMVGRSFDTNPTSPKIVKFDLNKTKVDLKQVKSMWQFISGVQASQK